LIEYAKHRGKRKKVGGIKKKTPKKDRGKAKNWKKKVKQST